jgi:hypothetical protein
MSEYTVHLIGGGDDETANITTEPVGNLHRITFRYRDKMLEADATDYFEAFCKIRTQLENERLIPFCYGASLNVFPSGMCRDMSAGMKAYRLTLGRKPSLGDLVGIFDEGADVMPASVALQKEHFNDWRKSIVAS